jgi:hypothetical protein
LIFNIHDIANVKIGEQNMKLLSDSRVKAALSLCTVPGLPKPEFNSIEEKLLAKQQRPDLHLLKQIACRAAFLELNEPRMPDTILHYGEGGNIHGYLDRDFVYASELRRVYAGLRPKPRTVFLAKEYYGFTIAEIVKGLGRSEREIRRDYGEAYEAIRCHLSKIDAPEYLAS